MENDEGVFHKMSNFVLEAKKRDLLKKEASKKYRTHTPLLEVKSLLVWFGPMGLSQSK